MRYKKKGAGMPKGAGNGMYMNGGRMYSTGGAVPGGTATPTVGVAFYKQNVPEVELAGAAGNREAAKVHEFSYTAIPGVFTSNQTPAGQKVFYDERGHQFTPEALRAHAERNTPKSRPSGAFPRGGVEASPNFSSMEAAALMTDYDKELATRGQQRSDARRAGTFNPNADYNKIPIPAGYSTFDSWMGDPSPNAYNEIEGRLISQERGDVEVAESYATGRTKGGGRANVNNLSDPNQPVYYNSKGEVSPTQMVLNSLAYSGRYGKEKMKQMEANDPNRANRIKGKKAAYKENAKKDMPRIQAKRNAYDANIAGQKSKK